MARNKITKSMGALTGAASVLLALPAAAQTLTITPTNTTVTAGTATFNITKGSTFTFLANLTSTGGTLSLNGDDAEFFSSEPGPTEVNPPTSPATVALDDSVFFNTLSRTVAGTAGNVALFTLTAGSGATTGVYKGSFTVEGGPNASAYNDLSTLNFTVNVNAAPEPSGFVAEGLGLLGLCALIVAKRRHAVSH